MNTLEQLTRTISKVRQGRDTDTRLLHLADAIEILATLGAGKAERPESPFTKGMREPLIWNPENAPTDNLPEGWTLPRECPKDETEVMLWTRCDNPMGWSKPFIKTAGKQNWSYLIRSSPKPQAVECQCGSLMGHCDHPADCREAQAW